jgi:hypothetical protein
MRKENPFRLTTVSGNSHQWVLRKRDWPYVEVADGRKRGIT